MWFRPKEMKERDALHGIPPSDIDRRCFWPESDAKMNGELWFYRKLKPHIKSIYDVGADTTFYTHFPGAVHYFEPISTSNIFQAEKVKITHGVDVMQNGESYFNNYGLSNITDSKQRITWEAGDVLPNPNGEDVLLGGDIYMETKRADEYIKDNNFKIPDFVSIDVEGHEVNVLQGFGDLLSSVKVIQFEYGGEWYSAGNKMHDAISLLKAHSFEDFFYLRMFPDFGLVPFEWTNEQKDHYAYCNIVCINSNEKELLWELKT